MKILAKLYADLLATIPESEVDLRARLNSKLNSLAFAAPELEGLLWRTLAGDLEELAKPPGQWQERVVEVFMDARTRSTESWSSRNV